MRLARALEVACCACPRLFSLRRELSSAYSRKRLSCAATGRRRKRTFRRIGWRYFRKYFSDQYRGVLATLRKKHRGLAPLGAFARLNIGAILAAAAQRSLPVRVRDRSSPDDPAYSGIYNMPLDNRDVEFVALLAEECCIDACVVLEIEAARGLLSPYPLQKKSLSAPASLGPLVPANPSLTTAAPAATHLPRCAPSSAASMTA